MTVVSSCDGVMGAEERLNAKSGYGYLKIVCSEMKIGWQLERISVRAQKEMAAGEPESFGIRRQ